MNIADIAHSTMLPKILPKKKKDTNLMMDKTGFQHKASLE